MLAVATHDQTLIATLRAALASDRPLTLPPDVTLHPGATSAAQGRIWRLAWQDGAPFAAMDSLTQAACGRRRAVELLLLETHCGADFLLDRAAFASIPGNQVATRAAAIDRAARLVARTLRHGPVPGTGTPFTPQPDVPTAARSAVTHLKLAGRRLAELAERMLLHESWMLGWVEAPIADARGWTECPPVRWIGKRTADRYLADPFGWPGAPDTVLCEEYPFASSKGVLKRLTLAGQDIVAEAPLTFPALPGHLSFPNLFVLDGAIHAMPESSAARRLSIFLWRAETRDWLEIATPLTDTAAADAVLFRHNGLFFITYTDVDIDPCDNLFLIYADSLAGPWRAHRRNPVRLDPRHARNGGAVFAADGRLYRPAQDCEACYGAAIRVMEITRCTPDDYEEAEITRIPPPTTLNPHGLHTLNAWNGRTLVDAKRMVFDPRQVLSRIRRKIFRR